MKFRLHHLSFVLGLAILDTAQAHDTDSQSGPLGKVSFPTSCNPKVQPRVRTRRGDAALVLVSAGEKAFRDVLAEDPACTIANWGIAAILMSNPLAGQGASPKGAEAGAGRDRQGRRVAAEDSARARLHRGGRRVLPGFRDPLGAARQEARAKAFEALAARYPDDDEAQIFSALYIAGTQSQADQTYAAYLKAAAILEKQFEKYPDHPGVAHYLIHSYDAPPIAEKGLTAARRYASIAPAAPHALHMPSHIFTRVGAWEESVATNRRSSARAKRRATRPTRHITLATTWCTRTCSSRATTTRGARWRRR